MKAATLKALRESIAHWRRMFNKGFLSEDSPEGNECALCKRFTGGSERCSLHGELCPVFKKSSYPGCRETPYYEAADAFSSGDEKLFKHHAEREFKFLKSLLPQRKAKQ